MNTLKQNPVSFYLRTFLYMFIALMLRLVMLAPLLLLVYAPAGSPWRYGALLCPVLLIFVVLPLRFSFADAVVQKSRQRFFSFDRALSMEHYGEKLGESLLHVLSVAKWAIPLVAMVGFIAWYYLYPLEESLAGVMETLKSLGEWGANLFYTIYDFVVKLFGQTPATHMAGSHVEGLYVVGIALALGLLILLLGVVRNSSTRYIWVLATREERNPRTEIRRQMRGRRFRQVLVALVNLVLWVPFLAVVYLQLKDSLVTMPNVLLGLMATGDMKALELTSVVLPLVLAFVLLYMPLLPVRRILTATFATYRRRHTAELLQPAQQDSNAYAQPAPVQFVQPMTIPVVQQAPVQFVQPATEAAEPVQPETIVYYPAGSQSVEAPKA
ncbi:MAG: hypothetical protein E7319_04645 [Clostridiales bacterium]|nr:hypothetical protein [Clostridiales bacterium]